jgi:hypothetical protein
MKRVKHQEASTEKLQRRGVPEARQCGKSGDWLKQRRADADLSQVALAAQLGLKYAFIAVENGTAVFDKPWKRGPPMVLNPRRSPNIYCCTMAELYRLLFGRKMSVLAFGGNRAPAWSEAELHTLLGALNAALASENGRAWETGVTERGDPQFYLLGPLPDQACELCVSRIGGRYILEDGWGRLLFEHQSLALVALHARAAVHSTRWPLVARALLLKFTVRGTLTRSRPLLAEAEMPSTWRHSCGQRLIARQFARG